MVAIVASLSGQLRTSSSSMASSSSGTLFPNGTSSTVSSEAGDREEHGESAAPETPGRALGEADGAVPGRTTVFDDGVPGVANLDPALLDALRQAAATAATDGVQLDVDSGWRSRAYQEHLLRDAVAKYGSTAEAARWVATPDTSAHVSGDAADIGPPRAAAWLGAHGARFGLCQIYGNEPWHYELRPDAADRGCPQMYADPTHDPRMQR
ncbi:MAG: M15 family metallopeptidase [Solirubrobacteraceae bacterium]